MLRILLIASALVASPALAESRDYWGIGEFFWAHDVDGERETAIGVYGRGGTEVSRFLSLEGQVAVGMGRRYASSIMARPTLPLGDSFRLYGLIGQSATTFDDGLIVSESYGAGVELHIVRNHWIELDVIHRADENGHEYKSLSFGVRTLY